jgi:ferredoxin
MECPDLFDIDDESGLAILLEPHPSDDRRDQAERAVRSCPEGAINLEEA